MRRTSGEYDCKIGIRAGECVGNEGGSYGR